MDMQYFTQEFDKIAYVEALIIIARADDCSITQQKKDFIVMQANLLGIDAELFFEEQICIPGVKSNFKSNDMSRMTKMSIIRDSISFAYMDGCYSQAEQEDIYKIAETLAIDKTDVDAMENWLKEYWLLLDKGNQLLGVKK